jgi:hypothetical protein
VKTALIIAGGGVAAFVLWRMVRAWGHGASPLAAVVQPTAAYSALPPRAPTATAAIQQRANTGAGHF